MFLQVLLRQNYLQKVTDFEFWSLDKKYGLKIPSNEINSILKLCSESDTKETGGIIVGHYNKKHDCAIVTKASKPPPDSKSGTTWFYRGISGLQTWLINLWYKKRRYYLGEWHYHPNQPPTFSPKDQEEMNKIALSKNYHCPEPILLIVGGNPASDCLLKAFVFLRNQYPVELLPTEI